MKQLLEPAQTLKALDEGKEVKYDGEDFVMVIKKYTRDVVRIETFTIETGELISEWESNMQATIKIVNDPEMNSGFYIDIL